MIKTMIELKLYWTTWKNSDKCMSEKMMLGTFLSTSQGFFPKMQLPKCAIVQNCPSCNI